MKLRVLEVKGKEDGEVQLGGGSRVRQVGEAGGVLREYADQVLVLQCRNNERKDRQPWRDEGTHPATVSVGCIPTARLTS